MRSETALQRAQEYVRIPFVGGEAVAAGALTRGQLRHRYRTIFHGIYVPERHEVSLRDRIEGAALVAPNAVIAGVAASAVHGARWVDDAAPIEIVGTCRRQRGLIVRNELLGGDDVTEVGGIRVTTPARTAFDLARHLPRDRAIARLDALMNSRPYSDEDVMLIAKKHHGARGLVRLRTALPLVDRGAESPKETWLRLTFIDAGLPKPTTQFVVRTESGRYVRRIDMVWEEFKVGAEYDGAQHLTDRYQYSRDVWAGRELQRMNWRVIHVIKEDAAADIVDAARTALLSRGWRP
jgi:very-short-patch-repair endonuclease